MTLDTDTHLLQGIIARELPKIWPELRDPLTFIAFFGDLHMKEQRELAKIPVSGPGGFTIPIKRDEKYQGLRFSRAFDGRYLVQEGLMSPENRTYVLAGGRYLSLYVDGQPADFGSPEEAVRRVLES